MRFLVVILAVAVMSLTGCDLDLGSGGDQYTVTFDVTDGEQGVVYGKGEPSYGNLPVYLYNTGTDTGTLIASKSGVALNSDGTVDAGGVTGDTSDYFYLKINGNTIDSGGSKVRYNGDDYNGLMGAGTVTLETHVTGETTIKATAFNILLDNGSTGIAINGTFAVLGIDLD